jgi:hypothetical protein
VQRAQSPQLTLLTAQPAGPNDPNARHVSPQGVDGSAGTQGNPWRTLAFAMQQLVPGQTLYVHAGDYDGGVATAVDGPMWVIGQAGARILDPAPASGMVPLLTIQHRSWVVRSLEFVATIDGVLPLLLRNAADVFVSGLRMQNFHAGAGIVVRSSTDCGIFDSTISGGQAWLRSGVLQESHGVLIGSGSQRIAVVGCRSSNNRGDSLQIQDEADNYAPTDPQRPAPDPPTDVVVQDCFLFETSAGGQPIGENAIDIKSCKRVVVLGNEMYGFRSNTTAPNSSPSGDAIVIHLDADEVIVEKNTIHDCGRAASVGGTGIGAGINGVGKVIFRRNVVYDMRLQPNPNISGTGAGIRCSPARQLEIYNNTFHILEAQQGMTTGVAVRLGDSGAIGRAVVLNNIVSGAGLALAVNDVGRLGCRANIYHAASNAYGQPIAFNNQGLSLAAWQQAGYDCDTVALDPQFVSAGTHNYRTNPASPARDKAVPISGSTDVVYGQGPDIGAIETP